VIDILTVFTVAVTANMHCQSLIIQGDGPFSCLLIQMRQISNRISQRSNAYCICTGKLSSCLFKSNTLGIYYAARLKLVLAIFAKKRQHKPELYPFSTGEGLFVMKTPITLIIINKRLTSIDKSITHH
jgi:hypothetical protein